MEYEFESIIKRELFSDYCFSNLNEKKIVSSDLLIGYVLKRNENVYYNTKSCEDLQKFEFAIKSLQAKDYNKKEYNKNQGGLKHG